MGGDFVLRAILNAYVIFSGYLDFDGAGVKTKFILSNQPNPTCNEKKFYTFCLNISYSSIVR